MPPLIPPGVGTVELLAELNTGNTDGALLDGDYLARKDGTAGLIRSEMGLAIPSNPGCGQGEREAGSLSCTVEDLGGGRTLRIEEFGPNTGPDQGRTWGRSYRAILGLGTGVVLFVDSVAGFTGTGAAGPAMAAPPLSKDQLRTLALRPELLAGAKLTQDRPPE